MIDKTYRCNRCKGEVENFNPGMLETGVLGIQLLRNSDEPMWKKLITGRTQREELLCLDCSRQFENFMNNIER